MTETNDRQERKTERSKKFCRTVDAVGWGLFFIWIGIAILANLGWGIGLIGIGILILGSWAAREYVSGSDCSRISRERY